MERPEILMTPGPTPVPPEVFLAQGSPLVYHRGPGYGRLLREVTTGLKAMLKTEGDVLVFTASGTGGLESAGVDLFSTGGRARGHRRGRGRDSHEGRLGPAQRDLHRRRARHRGDRAGDQGRRRAPR